MSARSNTEDPAFDQDGKSDSESEALAKSKKLIRRKSRSPKLDAKTVVLFVMVMIFVLIIWDAFFTAPEDRILRPDFSDKLLSWVQSNPGWGMGAISFVIAAAVVSMAPIGTPLTVGCGYIYVGVYGWKLGLFVATAVSMSGSCLGAVTCFFLGRYLMREQVRKWVRKYPLFDAIDVGKNVLLAAAVFLAFVRFSHPCIVYSSSSGIGKWVADHGHAVLDTRFASGIDQLHVWNHIDECLSLCWRQNICASDISDLHIHGSLGTFLHQQGSRHGEWRNGNVRGRLDQKLGRQSNHDCGGYITQCDHGGFDYKTHQKGINDHSGAATKAQAGGDVIR
jgi:uncharacterized membrane protein YdjX (TVP38/TMEM64 family)